MNPDVLAGNVKCMLAVQDRVHGQAVRFLDSCERVFERSLLILRNTFLLLEKRIFMETLHLGAFH